MKIYIIKNEYRYMNNQCEIGCNIEKEAFKDKNICISIAKKLAKSIQRRKDWKNIKYKEESNESTLYHFLIQDEYDLEDIEVIELDIWC